MSIEEIQVVEAVPAERLRIAGLTRFTTIDFPGKIAAVAFLQGCPWKCVYCHNPDMQPRAFSEESSGISWDYFIHFVEKRKGLIDGVVFSGGEPCVDPALKAAIRAVKDQGMAVGLHTGGAYTRRLADVLPDLDWVGFDVKAPLQDEPCYAAIVKKPHGAAQAAASLELLLASGVDFECRTTAHPDYLPEEKLQQLVDDLAARGVKTFALQIYRQSPGLEALLPRVGSDYPSKKLIDHMRSIFPNFIYRGV